MFTKENEYNALLWVMWVSSNSELDYQNAV